MIRGDARAILRSRLHEEVSDQWSDARLNTLLNLGLAEVQKKIIAIDPMAFVWIDKGDIVVPAGREMLYPWPEGFQYEFEVAVLGDDGKYGVIPRIDYHASRDYSSELAYAPHGAHFILAPAPTSAKVDGLQIKYMPTLTMASDAVTLPVKQGLHMAVVIYAERFALGDTGESRKDSQEELAEIINGIPQFYVASASTPRQLGIDLEVGY